MVAIDSCARSPLLIQIKFGSTDIARGAIVASMVATQDPKWLLLSWLQELITFF